MANKGFYDEKDVPRFQEEVCKKTCIMNGKCIAEEKDNHWFLMCPHYHSWKLEYGSFVWDNLKWEREHPDEMAEKKKKNLEIAKMLKEQKKAEKKEKSEED